jgi:hypothetical protein
MLPDVTAGSSGQAESSRKSLEMMGVEASCVEAMPPDSRVGDGIRTRDIQIHNLYFSPADSSGNPMWPFILHRPLASCKASRFFAFLREFS